MAHINFPCVCVCVCAAQIHIYYTDNHFLHLRICAHKSFGQKWLIKHNKMLASFFFLFFCYCVLPFAVPHISLLLAICHLALAACSSSGCTVYLKRFSNALLASFACPHCLAHPFATDLATMLCCCCRLIYAAISSWALLVGVPRPPPLWLAACCSRAVAHVWLLQL